MANRESQGLQIGMILLFMMTIALGLATYFFYGQSQTAAKKEKAADDAKKTAEAARDDQIYFNQYFAHITGAAPMTEAELNVVIPSIEGNPEMAAIHAAYLQDMDTYGEGLPDEKMNYRELPANLLQAIRKLNTANTELSLQANQLIAERDQNLQVQKKRADDAEVSRDSAVTEKETLAAQFTKDRDRIKTDQETQQTTYQTAIAQVRVQVSDRDKKLKSQDGHIATLASTVDKQKKRITELRDEPFESPDGRVAWVNQANGTVWVNLGLADGLRRQTTFSVYDHEAMNVAQAAGRKKHLDEEKESKRMIDERKGMIEITRVLDQHLAEARIVEDWAADPILPGDQIFSPSWKPGRKVRFALTGFMDVDGDNRTDRDLVRNLISMGGGRIDAEVHDDGAVEGELSANTRYLVRGTDPDGTDPKLLTAHGNMVGNAETLGIQEINLLMLLDLMGYKAEVRTVGLGKNADPAQFKAEPAEGRARTSTGTVSGLFKERQPPKRKKKGAY
jgi:hypothetical protein